jgi:hypothetical protein
MKNGIRIALASAAMVAGLAVAGAKPAAAQVSFSGSFPLPHGRISIGIGDPFFRVGSYVPYGYTVIEDPTYGYGFYYGARWIPVQPYGSTWVVVRQPYFRGGYVRPYARPYYGYAHSYGYARPYYGNSRTVYRNDRRYDNRQNDNRHNDGRRNDSQRNQGDRNRDRR